MNNKPPISNYILKEVIFDEKNSTLKIVYRTNKTNEKYYYIEYFDTQEGTLKLTIADTQGNSF